MANEKNKINELVAEEETTAELEVLVMPQSELEADADTSGFRSRPDPNRRVLSTQLESDLAARSEMIDRLQYDIEQLRARWRGLETEISARAEISDNLNAEINALRDSLKRKEKQLKERNDTIKSLKAEIRERHDAERSLEATIGELHGEIEALGQAALEIDAAGMRQAIEDQEQQILQLDRENATLQAQLDANQDEETQQNRRLLAEQAGQLASQETLVRELRERCARSEEYADSLRRHLQDAHASAESNATRCTLLQQSLDVAESRLDELQMAADSTAADKADFEQQLESLHAEHAEEIRKIRFELSEAQETVAQNELINEQLASDLVETRGFRTELENMLSQTEASSNARIDELERENKRLKRDAQEFDDELASKNEAINTLLAELAQKTEQLESIDEIEHVIQEIDERLAERLDGGLVSDKERMTRVLVGSVEGQELRFPLFKNRLTIGRTDQNDIQLKAPYISRRHAVIVTEGEVARVIDWGSKNGVFVNAERIDEHFLKNGDIVAIGPAKFRYEERPKRDI